MASAAAHSRGRLLVRGGVRRGNIDVRFASPPPLNPSPALTGVPEQDRSALLQIARELPKPHLFNLDSHRRQQDWLRERIGSLDPARLPQLNDGHRLPGREGLTTPAAVLMPIVNRPEGLTLLLTQRSDSLPDHPGQISFPGGRSEPHDPTAADT